MKCKICGKPHPTYKCWNNPDNKRVASSAEFNSTYRGDNSNWGQDRNGGRIDQRDNHYNDHFDYHNYRTDHQVNFCKIDNESSDIGKGLPRKDSKGTCHFQRSRLPTAIGTLNG